MPNFKSPLIAAMTAAVFAATPMVVFAQMPDTDQGTDPGEAADLPPNLANGLAATTVGGLETRYTFAGDGTYAGNDGTLGGWTLEAGFLCLAASTGDVTCTELPDGAQPGDSWSDTAANGAATDWFIPAVEPLETMPDGEGDEG